MLKRIMTKVSPEFKRECEEIKLNKIKNGTAKKMISDRRLTLAMVRSSKWVELKGVLINAEIREDI